MEKRSKLLSEERKYIHQCILHAIKNKLSDDTIHYFIAAARSLKSRMKYGYINTLIYMTKIDYYSYKINNYLENITSVHFTLEKNNIHKIKIFGEYKNWHRTIYVNRYFLDFPFLFYHQPNLYKIESVQNVKNGIKLLTTIFHKNKSQVKRYVCVKDDLVGRICVTKKGAIQAFINSVAKQIT